MSTVEVSTTGVSTTEMSTVGVSPDTYSDEYYYRSSESKDGFCPKADWTCTPLNIARKCGSFDSESGSCSGLYAYANATISDYWSISGNSAMQNEIYNCGPIPCGIDAMPLLNWDRELFPSLEVALPMSSRSLVRGLPGRREIHWLRDLSCVHRSCSMSPPRATVVAAYQAEDQSTPQRGSDRGRLQHTSNECFEGGVSPSPQIGAASASRSRPILKRAPCVTCTLGSKLNGTVGGFTSKTARFLPSLLVVVILQQEKHAIAPHPGAAMASWEG